MRDQTIRQLLRRTELSQFLNDPHSKVVEELVLPIAGARIDMAVINGSIHGYEIKSEVDTLQRLPSQLKAYSKVFDYLSIITEGKHHKKIIEILPKWVGVYVCVEKDGDPLIKRVRLPKKNKSKEAFI